MTQTVNPNFNLHHIPAPPIKDLFTSWWATRWHNGIREIGDKNIVARASSFVTDHRVNNIEIIPGYINARYHVAGHITHKIQITAPPLQSAAKIEAIRILASRPDLTTCLLNGYFHPALSQEFNQANISIFPDPKQQLEFECQCSNVQLCIHTTAAHIAASIEFDICPELILRFRGIQHELALLTMKPIHPSMPKRLPSRPQHFWHPHQERTPFPIFEPIEPAAKEAEIIRYLEEPEDWDGYAPFQDIVKPHYENATKIALSIDEAAQSKTRKYDFGARGWTT